MAQKKRKIPGEIGRRRILYHAAKSFLEVGYHNTRLTDLAARAQLSMGSLIFYYRHKENILLELLEYVLGEQFSISTELIREQCDEPALLYMIDTALELYMAESAEHLRDLYVSAYTIPLTANRIYELMTPKIVRCFAKYNPRLRTNDFYQMEIGSAAMMRGYISVPCSEELTIQEKVQRFHEATLRIYRVPPGTIRTLMQKLAEYDFAAIAEQSVQRMQDKLEAQSKTQLPGNESQG